MNPELATDEQKSVSLEEITSQGIGSGLEVERLAAEDASISVPFDPGKIDVITQARTVDLLLTRLKEGELNLSPDFQRRSNLWDEATKSALLESILLRIPIPSLYVAEDENGNYTVVDGLQRLCAIAHFVSVEALNKAVQKELNPLRLKGMESLREFNGKAFAELPRPLQRRINETELTLHVIRAGTPQTVKFNIFSRINRGGLPLTAQEIRNAIYRGDWKKYVREFAESRAFKEATQGKIKGERMEDLELVLRFVALYSQDNSVARPPEQNLDDFLNSFVEKQCAGWNAERWEDVKNAFERAMEFAPKIFGSVAFRKYSGPGQYRRPINRGLFEAESVAVARRDRAELVSLVERSTKVIAAFASYFKDDEGFQNALLYATGRGAASNKRLEIMERLFREVLSD